MSPFLVLCCFFTLIPVQLHYCNHKAQSLNNMAQVWLSGWLHYLTSAHLLRVLLLKPSALQLVLFLTAVCVAHHSGNTGPAEFS